MATENNTRAATTRAEEVEALTTGVNRNRLFPLLADFLLVCLLASLVIIDSYTDAINSVDVQIMMVLLGIFLSALVYFNIRKRKNVYHQFMMVISLTIVCVTLLFANALFGNHGNEIFDGSLPWVLPFLPLVVLYIYTFLVEAHSRIFFWAFLSINCLIFFYFLLEFTPDTKPAIIASIWMFGVVAFATTMSAGLLQLQRNIHGATVRHMLEQQAEMRARLKEQGFALTRDKDSGALNLQGMMTALQASSKPDLHCLCIVIPEVQKMGQALGAIGFEAYTKEIRTILEDLLGETISVARPFENVFIAWSESWGSEQVEKHKGFVSSVIRPVLYEEEDITPVTLHLNLKAGEAAVERDRLLEMIDQAMREGEAA